MAARTLHPFPARMAPEIALDAIPELIGPPLTVIDPMCGSGTVLGVAVSRGHHALGEDIDPLAVMMSKLTVAPVHLESITKAAVDVVSRAKQLEGVAPWGHDEETNRFVDFWFASKQKADLVSLCSVINELEDTSTRLALQMTVSKLIVTKAPKASLAADTSHSRPHRVKTESDFDVIAAFQRSSAQMTDLLSARNISGTGKVELGDARVLSSIPDSSADLAVTSPPYLNALDYLRGHRLALVWFGHLISDLRHRRGVSIGAERAISGVAPVQIEKIIASILDSVESPDALPLPMLKRYADDCLQFATQLRRTLKPGGKAVIVVGNSTLRGNYIANDQIVRYAMETVGFTLQSQRDREIPPNRRYMAINTSNDQSRMAKRMRKEVVLTMVLDNV